MKRKTYVAICSVLIAVVLSMSANAEIFKVTFSAMTTTYSSNGGSTTRLDFHVNVSSTMKTACEDISSLTIKAPDGTILSMDPLLHWFPNDQAYMGMFWAENFNSRVIPSGTYKITVKDLAGNSITKNISLTVKVLPVVTVIAPTPNATVPYMYQLQWNAVPGAKHYRIMLWNEYYDEPVYWNFEGGRSARTDKTYYNLYMGDLVPGQTYRLRIEARDSDLTTTNRSRSAWITFNVAP